MKKDWRVWIILCCNGLLYFLVNQLNEILVGHALFLHIDMLYLLFSALYFRLLPGFMSVLLTALFVASWAPIPMGWIISLYFVVYALLIASRPRIRREKSTHVIFLAVSLNGLIIIGMSLIMAGASMTNIDYWLRVVTDLFISEIFVFLFAFQYVNFQRILLYYLGTNIDAELQTL